jgi:hypothetical protein
VRQLSGNSVSGFAALFLGRGAHGRHVDQDFGQGIVQGRDIDVRDQR